MTMLIANGLERECRKGHISDGNELDVPDVMGKCSVVLPVWRRGEVDAEQDTLVSPQLSHQRWSHGDDEGS